MKTPTESLFDLLWNDSSTAQPPSRTSVIDVSYLKPLMEPAKHYVKHSIIMMTLMEPVECKTKTFIHNGDINGASGTLV